MPMLEWNDSLSVHIEEVDGQHKKCVEMVNELYDSMLSGSEEKTLIKIVGDMRSYAEFHFSTEETLMQKYDYPGIQLHENEHKDFINKVSQVEGELKSGKTSLSMDILNFLSSWLVTHINDTDKKMGEYLSEKGLS